MNKTQRFGAGGGAGDKFKMDRIQLFVTGDFISIDLRGCQMPTPRPRPHIPVLYREGGFTPPELYDAIEAADAWMYSRNIGVLSRCVSFTLGEWEKEISPRGEVMERSRVYGEIEEFTEFLPVRKSKFYGAFVLNRRVYLHAIDAPPARWRGDAGSSPLDGAPDALVDFHTGSCATSSRSGRATSASKTRPTRTSRATTSFCVRHTYKKTQVHACSSLASVA